MAKSTEEVLSEIAAIRQRVAERYPTAIPQSASGGDTGTSPAPEPVPLIDLMHLFHARDAAEGKVAAIGKVNPRRGGALNRVIQIGKRGIARGLGWFIRDQVDFNAAAVRGMTETIESLNEVNRSLAILSAEQARLRRDLRLTSDLASETRAEADTHLRHATDALSGMIRGISGRAEELHLDLEHLKASISASVGSIHSEMERRSAESAAALQTLDSKAKEREQARDKEDIRLLRTLADIQKASQQQLALVEGELRNAMERRAGLAEERASVAAKEAADAAILRMEASIHRELRLLRQRVGAVLERGAEDAEAVSATVVAGEALAASHGAMDSLALSERFRGSEEDVRQKLRIYLPYFEGCSPVADLGCGRGEFLDLFRDAGGSGLGVESNPELAGVVRRKGHETYEGNLFAFLRERAPESIGGIFCAHVIEHMPPEALVKLVSEAFRVLRSGGVLAFETPNPACLAIFATYFYLDPTHVRPVPAEFISYLLEETGFTGIEVLGLHPAEDEFGELKPLPGGFRQRFFGHLDYGVIARKH